MADQARPKSFRPLKRVDPPKGTEPPSAGAVYLEDEDGNGQWVSSVVQDRTDGITEADFDFESGKRWAEMQKRE